MTKQSTLKAHVGDAIDAFLAKCKFEDDKEFLEGINTLIDLIAFYKEEGRALFPEVFIFQNNEESLFKIINGEKKISFFEGIPILNTNFKKTLKSLAPLCTNGWICFYELLPGTKLMNVGIVSVLQNESSVSLRDQVLGMIDDGVCHYPAFFINNTGNRTVHLNGIGKNEYLISFSLLEANNLKEVQVPKLSESVLSNLKDDKIKNYLPYCNNFFQETFKNGHGNLIGVIEDSHEALTNVKKYLEGYYFTIPIDFHFYLRQAFSSNIVEEHYNLKHFSVLLSNMINVDGIIVLTDNFKIVGYNLFIKPSVLGDEEIGGARSRAFTAMEKSGIFKFGFFKSQDGIEKYFLTKNFVLKDG